MFCCNENSNYKKFYSVFIIVFLEVRDISISIRQKQFLHSIFKIISRERGSTTFLPVGAAEMVDRVKANLFDNNREESSYFYRYHVPIWTYGILTYLIQLQG